MSHLVALEVSAPTFHEVERRLAESRLTLAQVMLRPGPALPMLLTHAEVQALADRATTMHEMARLIEVELMRRSADIRALSTQRQGATR